MSTMTREAIEAELKNVIDPHTGVDIVTAKNVDAISVEGGSVSIEIVLGYPAKSFESEMIHMVVEAVPGATVKVASNTVAHEVQEGVKAIAGREKYYRRGFRQRRGG